MTLVLLIVATQVLDLLGFLLADGHGNEVGLAGAVLLPGGVPTVLLVKAVAILLLIPLAWRLRAHRTFLAGVATLGALGCLSEMLVVAGLV